MKEIDYPFSKNKFSHDGSESLSLDELYERIWYANGIFIAILISTIVFYIGYQKHNDLSLIIISVLCAIYGIHILFCGIDIFGEIRSRKMLKEYLFLIDIFTILFLK